MLAHLRLEFVKLAVNAIDRGLLLTCVAQSHAYSAPEFTVAHYSVDHGANGPARGHRNLGERLRSDMARARSAPSNRMLVDQSRGAYRCTSVERGQCQPGFGYFLRARRRARAHLWVMGVGSGDGNGQVRTNKSRTAFPEQLLARVAGGHPVAEVECTTGRLSSHQCRARLPPPSSRRATARSSSLRKRPVAEATRAR